MPETPPPTSLVNELLRAPSSEHTRPRLLLRDRERDMQGLVGDLRLIPDRHQFSIELDDHVLETTDAAHVDADHVADLDRAAVGRRSGEQAVVLLGGEEPRDIRALV